ncbi:MAG: hypothetical protein AAFQ54_13455 [Pseudomonadota bacterium]
MKQETGRPFKRAMLEAQDMAGDAKVEGDGYVLHQYPDRETYRKVQIAGNKAKLRMQFVKESHIRTLSEYINEEMGQTTFGICHGTRRGAEQAWFRQNLMGNPNIIGTEISDTADQFPDTVQWDFHEVNPDWIEKADFIYSNSWDHACEPETAFNAWFGALRQGGRLLLDYTRGQSRGAANALDPFGIDYEALIFLLGKLFGNRASLLSTIDTRRTNKEYKARVIIVEKK